MATRQIIYDWMLASDIRRIIDVFARAGAEIRFIGGCVRDSLLDREVRDVDIATDALPDSIVEILRDAGIKSIPTGIEHGTVTAIVEGRAFEITTYRRDIKTDGRHAVVEFGTDWREDAERRDFTINAMSITPDGNLHDPFDGVGDLAEGGLGLSVMLNAEFGRIFCGYCAGSDFTPITVSRRPMRMRLVPVAGLPSGFRIFLANVFDMSCCAFWRRIILCRASN